MSKNKRALSVIFLISLVAATLSIFGNAKAHTREQVKGMVIEEAQRNHMVPTSLALAVAKVESDFKARAMSSAGARGVMQIMPKTASGEFGVAADKLWNPRVNIRLGIDYLNQLYTQYGGRWDLALSHYNGGTLKGRGHEATPHSYTRGYVASVFDWSRRYARNPPTVALAVAATDGNRRIEDNHRMFDTPTLEKGWRYNPTVEAHWVPPSRKSALLASNFKRGFRTESVRQSWMPVDGETIRRSDRYRMKVDILRRKFRKHLQWNKVL